ncbi:TVP38/TMEM64 family protein, partial [Halobacteriales archaeon QH_10_67_13]
LTTLPLRQLVAIAVIGRAPAFFLVNVVGESFQAGQVGLALGLGTLVVALSVVGYYYRATLITLFDS